MKIRMFGPAHLTALVFCSVVIGLLAACDPVDKGPAPSPRPNACTTFGGEDTCKGVQGSEVI